MSHGKKTLLIASLVASLTFTACGSSEVRKADRDARAQAEREIREGRPTLLYIGLPSATASPLDPETGLLRYSAGCVVSDAAVAAVEAHNEVVLAALKAGCLQGMTFEDRVLTAAEAHAPFDADGFDLELGASRRVAGQEYEIEIAPRHGRPEATPYVFVTEVDGGRRRELVYLGEPKARLALAHGARTLLVRDDRFRTIRTFDLHRAVELQVFRIDDAR